MSGFGIRIRHGRIVALSRFVVWSIHDCLLGNFKNHAMDPLSCQVQSSPFLHPRSEPPPWWPGCGPRPSFIQCFNLVGEGAQAEVLIVSASICPKSNSLSLVSGRLSDLLRRFAIMPEPFLGRQMELGMQGEQRLTQGLCIPIIAQIIEWRLKLATVTWAMQ